MFEMRVSKTVEPFLQMDECGDYYVALRDVETEKEVPGTVMMYLKHNPHVGYYQLWLCAFGEEDIPIVQDGAGYPFSVLMPIGDGTGEEEDQINQHIRDTLDEGSSVLGFSQAYVNSMKIQSDVHAGLYKIERSKK